MVHLVATPAASAEFVGWRGDTSGVTSLDLTANRAWDVTAVFLSTIPIDAAAAARALLGGPALSAAAVAYLDAIGNQNGGYDIGDYAAWLRRTGQRVPVALRQTGWAP